jgi:hypothetical protein
LQPANRSNLILLSDALLKAANRLHRQKASCSANLDSSGSAEILQRPGNQAFCACKGIAGGDVEFH